MAEPNTALYPAATVRNIDRYAIDERGVDSYMLMTRAAQSALSHLRQKFNHARRLTIVCGAGNNAGDGFVLARLAQDAGFTVRTIALVPVGQLHGDAKRACQDLQASGAKLRKYDPQLFRTTDVVVDAMLGTGLTRTVEGEWLDIIRAMNRCKLPIVALDIPSGIDGDTGQARPEAVVATMTVTFVGMKTGLFNADGLSCSGEVVLDRLGLDDDVYQQFTPVARLTHNAMLDRVARPRNRNAHKGDYGRVLIAGGGSGMPGAAALCSEAALRAGAGMVKVACHPDSVSAIVGALPEAMCHGIERVAELDPLLEWATVVAIGPGLGRDQWAKDVWACIRRCELSQIVDADALTLLAQEPDRIQNRIITPHPGEAATLLGCKSKDVQSDRFAAANTLQERFGGVAVLKGAGTVIAEESDLQVCPGGNPGMSTAGMGDVLTGIIAGLLAQYSGVLSQSVLAATAVHLHATAGDLAAGRLPRGMIASDLLPVIRELVN